MAISPELQSHKPDPGEMPVEPDQGPVTPPGPGDPDNPLPPEHPKP